MALTSQAIYSILNTRLKKPLAAAELNEASDSHNAGLVDGILWALRQLNYTTSSYVQVSDVDLSAIANSDVDDILALAELRALGTCIQNIDTTDERFAEHGKWGSQYPKRLMALYDKLYVRLNTKYNFDMPYPEFGVISDANFITSSQ